MVAIGGSDQMTIAYTCCQGVEMGSDAELNALLELKVLPGIGDRLLSDLIARYGSPAEALKAPATELGEEAARLRGTAEVRRKVDRALRTIETEGIRVLRAGEPRYPEVLTELHDPPPLLFVLGRLELLDRPGLAIVGARRPSTYGRDIAELMARGATEGGLVVTSGMARGIDGIAHQTSLEGGTIGVLGAGIDVVYPHQHGPLYERMREEGLLLTEFLPGEPPRPFHFPKRNRLIAALARGVLVIEAAARSGALITVDHALDLGREVMAIPGPIGRELSEGTNALIRDGAAIVLHPSDIFANLGIERLEGDQGDRVDEVSVTSPVPVELRGSKLEIWRVLETEPRHAEEIADRAGLDPATTLAGLLELEVEGLIHQLPGLRFTRRLGEEALRR